MKLADQGEIDLIKASGMFDEPWYLRQYPDVQMLGLDPVEHYLWLGHRLQRSPSPKFNVEKYLKDNPSVEMGKTPPLLHFLQKSSMSENSKGSQQTKADSQTLSPRDLISGSEFFDVEWYRKTYHGHVGEEDCADHYLRIGSGLGFDPGPNFSTLRYLENYPDIRAAGMNPLYHYILHGKAEGRSPKPDRRPRKLGVLRLSHEETGNPDTILKFDDGAHYVPGISSEKIAIHVHLYHTEMASEIVHYLCNVRHPFVLLVSVQQTEDIDAWRSFFLSRVSAVSDVVVRAFENRGRDVAPWVVGFADIIKQSTLFCHIHTKRSTHNKSHGGWFRFLSHTTLGSIGVVDGILNVFRANSDVSVVAPCYFWTLRNQPNYGKNKPVVSHLCDKLGIDVPDVCPDYPAGSFFWARTSVLAPLFKIDLGWEDFAEEGGQKDETIAHGIERIMGILPTITGTRLHMVTVDVAFDLLRYVDNARKRIASSVRVPEVNLHPAPSGKVAMYSCVSGGYEAVTSLASSAETDRYIFTDDETAAVPQGHTRRVSNYISHIPVRTARYVKTHPHLWFPDYDYAIWIDSNVHFFGNVSKYIKMLDEADADCGFIAHPTRNSFIDETKELIEERVITKDREVMERQAERYAADAKVVSSRLLETNFFICRPKSPKVAEFMSVWWGEINRFTHRDQVSVNYAIEKSGIKWIKLLPEGRSTRDSEDFVHFDHKATNRSHFIEMLRR